MEMKRTRACRGATAAIGVTLSKRTMTALLRLKSLLTGPVSAAGSGKANSPPVFFLSPICLQDWHGGNSQIGTRRLGFSGWRDCQ